MKISMQAFKTAITAKHPSTVFKLRNESINGGRTGVVIGFASANGKHVYVQLNVVIPTTGNHMWRVTRDDKDSAGQRNIWIHQGDPVESLFGPINDYLS